MFLDIKGFHNQYKKEALTKLTIEMLSPIFGRVACFSTEYFKYVGPIFVLFCYIVLKLIRGQIQPLYKKSYTIF